MTLLEKNKRDLVSVFDFVLSLCSLSKGLRLHYLKKKKLIILKLCYKSKYNGKTMYAIVCFNTAHIKT